jgi:hypothetical protein
MNIQRKMILMHYLALVVFAPFVAALMDFQINIFEEHGLVRSITSIPSGVLPALIFLAPLSLFSVPLSIIYHVVIKRGHLPILWAALALVAIYPVLGWLFALQGHYVVRHAVFGGLVGGIVAWLIICRVWRNAFPATKV